MEKIEKGKLGKRNIPNPPFFARSGHILTLSTQASKYLLPHKYVEIYKDKQDIVLIPSDNHEEFRAYESKGRIIISGRTVVSQIDIPEGKRFPCIKQEDGTIRVCLSEEVK